MSPVCKLAFSKSLGRKIRQDDISVLGISTQTLFELAIEQEDWDHAAELAQYFCDEVEIIGQALYTWIKDILTFRLNELALPEPTRFSTFCLKGISTYNPGRGDLNRAISCCQQRDAMGATANLEAMRIRWCALHDTLVVWIQELLTGIANTSGEEAVFACIVHAYENIWKPRYESWHLMSPEEKLQLSVEGMRGHLSGKRRRGDLAIIDEGNRYMMVLDPCGSCGILRNGDPESGRAAYHPAGNKEAHPWTWGRVGVGWYAVHSPIVMEYLWYARGEPPMRPLADCDTTLPCRWFIYKDPSLTRPEHFAAMGFSKF